MKKLLLITILYLPFTVMAQKLTKPKIDKITGDTSWSTSREKLYLHGNYLTGQGEAVEFIINKSGKLKSTTLMLIPQTTNLSNAFSILKGQKAFLKLSNNTTITLSAAINDIGTASASYVGDYMLTSGQAIGQYDLSATDIEALRTATVTFLRIEETKGDFDCDIKPKNAETLKKAIELIAPIK